jgi:hypothetical protein
VQYRSSVRLFGLPVIHVTTGEIVDGRPHRGIAKGWIAIGDIAFGLLFAAGGVAVGGVAVGGLAGGVLTVGGLAVGLGAVGGLAIGGLAAGGAAFGWSAAFGGLAFARYLAVGGAAVAAHANDATAESYVNGHTFFRAAQLMLDFTIVLVFLPVVIGMILWFRSRTGSGRAA